MNSLEFYRLILQAQSVPEPNSGCRLWLGDLNDDGYGTMSSPLFRTKLVHRQAFICEGFALPDFLTLDHTCRVRCCIEPAHLEITSRSENSRRVHRRVR